MRRVILLFVLAAAAGCGKNSAAPAPEAPREPGFSEDSPEDTLAWLAGVRAASHTADDAEVPPGLKAAAESMKGRALQWPAKVAERNLDNTFGLVAYSLNTDPPGPRGEEAREWHTLIACKPFNAGAAIPEDAPFVRTPDPGFPPSAGDWTRGVKRGGAVRLAGTVAAVQLHRRSWVTGYGVRDRIVHSELGLTLHLSDAAVSPPK
jgi:hypothetical protein